jgi:diacylglycerol kinase (ATP)
VRRLLAERGIEHEVVITKEPGEATTLARAAVGRGCRFVVSVGGDGTLQEVVNGLLRDDRAIRPEGVFGVVAAGTACDFVRTVGIPALPSHAAAHLDGPEAFAIDIGKLTCIRGGRTVTRYWHNVAEAGLGAEVARLARYLPSWLGPTLYPLAFWGTVLRYRGANARVDLVDRRYEGPVRNLVIANGQFFGRGMKVAPKAVPTDGLLDVLVEHASPAEEIAFMPRLYRGEHLPHEDILEAKRVRVSIEAQPPMRVEADGELVGETPASFEVLRDALRLKV